MPASFSLGSYRLVQAAGTVPGPNWGMLAIADLDGNGYGDFVMTGSYYPNEPAPAIARQGFVVMGGPSGYTVAAAPQFAIGSLLDVHAREFAFADLNEDGFLDVFIADHGYDAPPFPGQQNLLFLSDATSGPVKWVAGSLPPISDYTHSVAVGDVDNNGHLDLLAGNGGPGSSPYFLLGDGSGHFTQSTALLPPPNMTLGLTSCVLADLDLDGWADLVLGQHKMFSANQLFFSQGGSFAQAVGTALPQPPAFGPSWVILDVQATDVNFDGLPDLLLAYQADVMDGGWLLQVLVNQGDRTFTDESASFIANPAVRSGGVPDAGGSPAWIEFLQPQDLNGDGRMDFFVRSKPWGQDLPDDIPVALIHQPDGSFEPVTAGALRAAGMPGYMMNIELHLLPGGEGEFALVAGYPANGGFAINTVPIAFTPAETRWIAGGAGADALTGTDGDDDIGGFGGNDTIAGGVGIDVARYNATRAQLSLSHAGAQWTIASAVDGSDVVTGVERLKLADTWLALDLDGHAGSVAKILGALFGPEYLTNQAFVGIGLDKLDSGMTYAQLVSLVVDTGILAQFAGSASNTAFVDYVYENVVGATPSAAQRDYFVGLLDNGTFTQASLALEACETPENAAAIGLVGLAAAGIAYQPVG